MPAVQAKHALTAKSDLAQRAMDSQVVRDGGAGGARLNRHLIYSRFRSVVYIARL